MIVCLPAWNSQQKVLMFLEYRRPVRDLPAPKGLTFAEPVASADAAQERRAQDPDEPGFFGHTLLLITITLCHWALTQGIA
jgi:hypothetical protein